MLHEGTMLATPTKLHRRAITVALACAPLAPHFVRAQSGRKIYRVGVLRLGASRFGTLVLTQAGVAKPFMNELQRLGLIEGSNLLIEVRAVISPSGLDAAASELVALNPDVIFVQSGTAATMAVAKATATIPIVFLLSNNPVERGVVASLSHPGGNMTGNFVFSRQLDLKRFQLLTLLIGDDTSIAVLDLNFPSYLLEAYNQTTAGRAGRIHFFEIREPTDFATSFERLVDQGIRGVAINSFPLAGANESLIAALTERYRLPAVADGRGFAESGVLLSYSIDWEELAVSAAGMVFKVLNGAKPSDMALSQATRYELIVNLKTANVLGVTVPRALLMSANQVIR